jgi:hypothetical protein
MLVVGAVHCGAGISNWSSWRDHVDRAFFGLRGFFWYADRGVFRREGGVF